MQTPADTQCWPGCNGLLTAGALELERFAYHAHPLC